MAVTTGSVFMCRKYHGAPALSTMGSIVSQFEGSSGFPTPELCKILFSVLSSSVTGSAKAWVCKDERYSRIWGGAGRGANELRDITERHEPVGDLALPLETTDRPQS